MTKDAAALPATMTAWRQHRYGGADAVSPEDTPVPRPDAGEVLVRVRATALNSADVRVMRGDPLLLRAAFGLRRPRTAVQGRDVAGTVVAVGAGVSSLRIGDEVLGEVTGGGLAPFVAVPADALVLRPAGLDPVVAATLPLAGGTAWQALDRAGLGVDPDAVPARGSASGGTQTRRATETGVGAAPAPRVLVVGAGGGVGSFAVRLAVLRGAEVTALAGERSLDVVRRLGAATVLDHRRVVVGDLAAASFDVVLVVAGEMRLRALRRLVVPGGVVVLVGGGTNRVTGPLGAIARAAVMSIGSRRPIRFLAATATPAITSRLAGLAADGALVPHIERTWPLAEAGAALAHVDAGRTVGKVVVVAE